MKPYKEPFFKPIFGTLTEKNIDYQYIRDGFFGSPLDFRPFDFTRSLVERWKASRDYDSTAIFIAKQFIYLPTMAITSVLGLAYIPFRFLVLTPIKAISSLVRLVTEGTLLLLEKGTQKLFGKSIGKPLSRIFQIPRLIIRATLSPRTSAEFAAQADKKSTQHNGGGFINWIRNHKFRILSTAITIVGLACVSAALTPLALANTGGGGIIAQAVSAIANAVKSSYLAHVLFGTAVKTTVGGTVGLGKTVCQHIREQTAAEILLTQQQQQIKEHNKAIATKQTKQQNLENRSQALLRIAGLRNFKSTETQGIKGSREAEIFSRNIKEQQSNLTSLEKIPRSTTPTKSYMLKGGIFNFNAQTETLKNAASLTSTIHRLDVDCRL